MATVVALAVGGCDLVFAPGGGPGGTPTDAAHGGDGDTFADAPIDADLAELCPGQTATHHDLHALADADIASAAPTIPDGTRPIVVIDGDSTTYGLFKFDIQSLPTGTPKLMTLTLRYAIDACGACTDCALYEQAGGLLAMALVSDWQEDEVTWEHTGIGGRLWNGAATGTDHSVSSVTAVHDVGDDAVFTVESDQMTEFWLGFADLTRQRMSFLVVANGQTHMAVRTEEGEATCTPVDRASLDLVFCE